MHLSRWAQEYEAVRGVRVAGEQRRECLGPEHVHPEFLLFLLLAPRQP